MELRSALLSSCVLHRAAGIGNPLGVKISDKCTPEELLEIIDAINPGTGHRPPTASQFHTT